jgi:tRNA threonylcarbamoyladenosine biosynthesis protein TsaB
MRILAFETSGNAGSVALLDATAGLARLISEATVPVGQRTAKSLAPLTHELLKQADWLPASIELITVAVGPGSFTGLRIGVTMAKTFAYAVGAQVIGINTLEVIAAQAPPSAAPLWAVIDAQRQELFTAKFASLDDGQPLKFVSETKIMTLSAWYPAIEQGDRVSGPGLQRLPAPLPTDVTKIDETSWQPQASTVGQLAWQQYQGGRRDDLWKLAPIYYRPSAAEEKAAKTNLKSQP